MLGEQNSLSAATCCKMAKLYLFQTFIQLNQLTFRNSWWNKIIYEPLPSVPHETKKNFTIVLNQLTKLLTRTLDKQCELI